MIHKTLLQLQKYLTFRFKQVGPPDSDWVVELEALPKDDRQLSGKNIVITLIRIEEETSNKQQVLYKKAQSGSKMYMMNPDITLNLYILISAQSSDYSAALKQISETMRLLNASKDVPPGINATKEEKDTCMFVRDLNIELQKLSFEQNNSLWQTIGRTVAPAAYYKVRLVTLVAPDPSEEVGIISIDEQGRDIREDGLEPIEINVEKK